MSENAVDKNRRCGSHWRIVGWGLAVLFLLLPLIAMQFTDEVNWDESDFAVAAALIGGAGITFELVVRMTGNVAYRAAVGTALATALILIWMNLTVGIIGTEDNPANLMHGGVLVVGLVGAIVVRFQPRGMACTLMAMALTQSLVGGIALIAGLGSTGPTWPANILGLTGLFAALWLISAMLFWTAARTQTPAGDVG